MPLPTQTTVAALAQQLTLRNSLENPLKVDVTYQREWKKYISWVTTNRQNNVLPPGDKYLTRSNVDLYFSHIVAARHDIIPDTARRTMSSLQSYADNVEYIDGTEKFEMESIIVKRALETQRRLHLDHVNRQIVDPHENLPTDVLTQSETREVLRIILVDHPLNWMDLALSWTHCESTFDRNDTMRKLRFSDLRHNTTHGPVEEGIDSLMMSYILQKRVHKERSKKKRITGAWRHKDYIRCSTGHLSMNLMCRLYGNADLNFYKNLNGPKKGRCDWQDEKLIQGWKDDKAVQKAYNTVLDQAGVSWGKVSHLRKAGMEYASSRGELDEAALGSLSKHTTSKLSKCYNTELFPPVLRVMAGFDKDDVYFCPRTSHCSREMPEAILSALIFPRINEWRQQCRDPVRGDHSEAAKNFLWGTLPFLALVAFQDGIYWIKDFPDHEASRLLVNIMPPWYPRYASTTRQIIADQVRDVEAVQLSALNNAAQGAFNLAAARSDDISRAVVEIGSKLDALLAEVRQQQTATAAAAAAAAAAAQLRNRLERTFQPPRVPPTQLQPRGGVQQARAAIGAASAAAGTAARNVNDTLRAIPLFPAFPPFLPTTMATLLEQHKAHKLSQYEQTRKIDWPLKLRTGYSRRIYLFKQIVVQAHRLRSDENFDRVKMPRAAAALDSQRDGKSLTKFMETLKAADPATLKRKRD